MGKLNPWCALATDILKGNYDDDLDQIDAAVKYRKKDMFRAGAKFKLVDTRNPELEGKTATVIRVNAKRIAVGVGEAVEEYGFKTWSGGEYNVPAGMLAPLT